MNKKKLEAMSQDILSGEAPEAVAQDVVIHCVTEEALEHFAHWKEVVTWKTKKGFLAAPGLGVHCIHPGPVPVWAITHLSSGCLVLRVPGTKALAVEVAQWLYRQHPGIWGDGTPVAELAIIAKKAVKDAPVAHGWDTGKIPGVEAWA